MLDSRQLLVVGRLLRLRDLLLALTSQVLALLRFGFSESGLGGVEQLGYFVAQLALRLVLSYALWFRPSRTWGAEVLDEHRIPSFKVPIFGLVIVRFFLISLLLSN